MKFTLFKSLPIIFCLLLITGCGDSKQDNKSDKITTEVPYEFSKNKAVKEYFSALDGVVNEYVTMIENMAKASNDAKNDEDGGFGAAMNMLSNASGSVLNMAPLLDKMDKEMQSEIPTYAGASASGNDGAGAAVGDAEGQ